MKFAPDDLYHIFNQGNDKQPLFLSGKNYYSFLELYKNYVAPNCETMCWCLMPNHFHFIIAADERCLNLEKQGGLLLDPITNGFRKLLSSYAHKFNEQSERTGSLFRPKTKSKCLSETDYASLNFPSLQSYLINCFHYIHENPVKAGLVINLEDWIWSSYRFYKGLRKDSFCNKAVTEKFCGIIF